MATKKVTVERVIDDYTKEEISEVEHRTVEFDGKTYLLDLSEESADMIDALLTQVGDAKVQLEKSMTYLSEARIEVGAFLETTGVRGVKIRPEPQDGGAGKSAAPLNPIRAWAVEQGLMTAEARGRIPGKVLAAYNEAHPISEAV
jgi:Lsr2 protein